MLQLRRCTNQKYLSKSQVIGGALLVELMKIFHESFNDQAMPSILACSVVPIPTFGAQNRFAKLPRRKKTSSSHRTLLTGSYDVESNRTRNIINYGSFQNITGSLKLFIFRWEDATIPMWYWLIVLRSSEITLLIWLTTQPLSIAKIKSIKFLAMNIRASIPQITSTLN